MATYYVTKWALTSGILRIDGGTVCGNMLVFRQEHSQFDEYAHGRDWHESADEAIQRAEEMRSKRIASLKKQLNRLETMTFEAPS